MTDATRCPKCGALRPPGAVDGLCPQCLLGHALELGVPSSAHRDPIGRLRASRAPWVRGKPQATAGPRTRRVSRFSIRLITNSAAFLAFFSVRRSQPGSRRWSGRDLQRFPPTLPRASATSFLARSPGEAWVRF